MSNTRRDFLKVTGGVFAAGCLSGTEILADDRASDRKDNPLAGKLGVTTSSVGQQLSGRADNGKFTLLELPRILRDELDMRVIDLNTSSFASTDRAYLDRVRKAADDAGCVLTNLKMNQRDLDMNSPDQSVRDKALTEYKRSIDVAAHLGLKWARPLPRKDRPDIAIHVASYRELCDYAADRNVQMLVENFGWMQADPDSVVKLVKAIGSNVAACPDTGNWDSDELRYAGLAKTFPIAVTCDFKARALGPKGEHKLYDLKKCFEVGWQAGFRGPWCFEHANADTKVLLRELGLLREMLHEWMAEFTK
jgi:hypothetical protein